MLDNLLNLVDIELELNTGMAEKQSEGQETSAGVEADEWEVIEKCTSAKEQPIEHDNQVVMLYKLSATFPAYSEDITVQHTLQNIKMVELDVINMYTNTANTEVSPQNYKKLTHFC